MAARQVCGKIAGEPARPALPDLHLREVMRPGDDPPPIGADGDISCIPLWQEVTLLAVFGVEDNSAPVVDRQRHDSTVTAA